MKAFGNVQEIFQAPPPGTYPIEIIEASPELSTKGNPQIVLDMDIIDGKYKGTNLLDWIGTDPEVKGAGISRGKLRVLLQNTQFAGLVDGTQGEVPDTAIAAVLKGQRLYAVIENSPRLRKDEQGNRTKEHMTQLDPATGQLITIMNADVKGYVRHFAGQQPAAAQAHTAPVGAPVFAQAPIAAAPAAAAPVAAQGGLPFTPNYNAGAAVPPWQQGVAPVNGAATTEQAPVAEASGGGRRRRGGAAAQG